MGEFLITIGVLVLVYGALTYQLYWVWLVLVVVVLAIIERERHQWKEPK